MSAFYLPWDRVNINTFLIKTENKNRKNQEPFGITQARRGQCLCRFSPERLYHCSSGCALCMSATQLSGFQLFAVWLGMASVFPWTRWFHEGAIRAGSPALSLTFSSSDTPELLSLGCLRSHSRLSVISAFPLGWIALGVLAQDWSLIATMGLPALVFDHVLLHFQILVPVYTHFHYNKLHHYFTLTFHV